MMTHLTKTISLFALGVSLAFVAPGELPTADNDYSVWAEAEAANIIRNRIKRRNNGLYKSVVTTDETNGEGIDLVEVTISTLDGQPLVETAVKKADWTRVSFKGVDGLSAEVEPIEYQDGFDNFNMPTQPGDTTTAEIGKTKTFLSVTNNGDGSFDITLEGEPKDMNDFCAVKVVDSGLCGTYDPDSLRLGGQPLIQNTIEADWDAKLPGKIKPADIDGTKLVIAATVYGESGEVLDRSTTAADVGDAGGEELDYAEFRIEGDDDDLLMVISEPDNPEATAALGIRISSQSLSTDVIDTSDVSATPYRWFEFEPVFFIESDNVTDMEYNLNITFFDDLGNIVSETFVPVIGSENSNAFIGESPEGTEVSTYSVLEMNDDNSDSFSLDIAVTGDGVADMRSASVFIEPIDGGSEADPADVISTQSQFLNTWAFPAPSGAFEILANSETVGYDISLYSDAKLTGIYNGTSTLTEGLGNQESIFIALDDFERDFPVEDLSSGNNDTINLKPPTPYRGKGIRYVGEIIRRKAGKSAAK